MTGSDVSLRRNATWTDMEPIASHTNTTATASSPRIHILEDWKSRIYMIIMALSRSQPLATRSSIR